jgi:hypothetical protein
VIGLLGALALQPAKPAALLFHFKPDNALFWFKALVLTVMVQRSSRNLCLAMLFRAL